jgi:hypothetical protein
MAETGDGGRDAYVHRRKGRYMAQTLEAFEESIEPLIPASVAEQFKVLVRRKMNALAADVIELIELEDKAINGAAQDIKDRLFADGAAQPTARG